MAQNYRKVPVLWQVFGRIFIPFLGLLQTYEFYSQRCEIKFQTNINRIQFYEIEYHTIEI